MFSSISRALFRALLRHGNHCKKLNMEFKTPHTLLEVMNVLDHEYIETRKPCNIMISNFMTKIYPTTYLVNQSLKLGQRHHCH